MLNHAKLPPAAWPAAILGFLLCLAWAPAWAGPVSPQGIELVKFTAEAPANPRIGDMVKISFILKNVSEKNLRFGDENGVFVGARWAKDASRAKKLNRDFGYKEQGSVLTPGQSITYEESQILDMPGYWSFWPAFQMGGKFGPFDKQKKIFEVSLGMSQAKETSPPPPPPPPSSALKPRSDKASPQGATIPQPPPSASTRGSMVSGRIDSGGTQTQPGDTFAPPPPTGMTFSAPDSQRPGSTVVWDGSRYLPLQVFPENNPWNTDISGYKVHPRSDQYIANIGANTSLHPDFGSGVGYKILGYALKRGKPHGIPYVVVRTGQPKAPISFRYAEESDPGPYPIPLNAPIETSGDRHILAVDYDQKKLYELFGAERNPKGFSAGSGAVFNLTTNKLRPLGWTSADAAGLPVFPGLVRHEEVHQLGEIRHALRFTAEKSRRAYIKPATHYASSNRTELWPPMGLRVRLKKDFDISPYPPSVQVILRALKKYGMFLADNGMNWGLSGAPSPHWEDDDLKYLKRLKGKDFEAVYTGEAITD